MSNSISFHAQRQPSTDINAAFGSGIILLGISLLTCLLFFSTPALASDAGKPLGKNCDLSSPPAAAGEGLNHGITLRIYPRAKDIDARYTGCQVLFAPEGEKWIVVFLTEVVNGDPVRIWSADETDTERLACRFKQGKVVQGNPAKCPVPEFILMQSLPPGCVRTMQDAFDKHGLSGPRQPECEYQ